MRCICKNSIQPLLNEGAAKEGHSCFGVSVSSESDNKRLLRKTYKGNVAFVGGPLYYLPQLRQRFIETLGTFAEQVIIPEDSHLFVALGAAISSQEGHSISFKLLKDKLQILNSLLSHEVERLRPLLLMKMSLKHSKKGMTYTKSKEKNLKTIRENASLELMQALPQQRLRLLTKEGSLLYSYYGSNEGSPLKSSMKNS